MNKNVGTRLCTGTLKLASHTAQKRRCFLKITCRFPEYLDFVFPKMIQILQMQFSKCSLNYSTITSVINLR